MRVIRSQARQCDRAREWASRRLDGELSQFESALLDSHLAQCEGCAVFAAEISAVTSTLRAAPLQGLESPVVLLRRRRVSFRPLQAVAAALVAAAVGFGALVSSLESRDTVDRRSAEALGIDTEAQQELLREFQKRDGFRTYKEIQRLRLVSPPPRRTDLRGGPKIG